MNSIFGELTIVLLIAGFISILVSFFRQPSIIAYIITGLIVGPLGYNRLHQGDILNGLAEIGITLLLFMVGLELDVDQLKRFGRSALYAGLGQILFTLITAFALLKMLGTGTHAAWFIALGLTFSSTIIVVKLLSEKRDLESLYGKLTIGILLMQDFVAIFALIILTSVNGAHSGIQSGLPVWQTVFLTLLKGLVLGLVVLFSSKKILPRIMHHIGKSDELLLVFSLGWALGLAALVSLPFVGFSLEIGGFLAGLALANSAVHYQIGARIKSLRDFFIIIFFIVLGSQLNISDVGSIIVPAIALSAFVLVIKPLITLILLTQLDYKPRTSFMSGVTLSQISEFSLILGALGYKMGYIGSKEVALITLVGIITIALSSYSVIYMEKLYEWLKGPLRRLESHKSHNEAGYSELKLKNHVVLIGAHRLGEHVIEALDKQHRSLLMVDFNPETAEKYRARGIMTICGDITDSHIQELANLATAKMIISTVPDLHDNLLLAEVVEKENSKSILIATAHDETEALLLYDRHVDYVILPHFIGGMHLAKLFKDGYKLAEIRKLKEHHLKVLNQSI